MIFFVSSVAPPTSQMVLNFVVSHGALLLVIELTWNDA